MVKADNHNSNREYSRPLDKVKRKQAAGLMSSFRKLTMAENAHTFFAMSQIKSLRLFTIGYEGRPVDEFIDLFSRRGIKAIIDVREHPYSRNRNYSRRNLESALATAGIEYIHLQNLGSPKDLRDKLRLDHDYDYFKSHYIDYLNTQTDALSKLSNLLFTNVICLLCMERDPLRCHRSLIAERLRQCLIDKASVEIINL